MGFWIDVARVATALNVLLLVGLSYVWARNYRRFHSKHTLGLTVFALLLLAENALGMYFYNWHPDVSTWLANSAPVSQSAMTALTVLELGALLFLSWITWD